MSAYRRDRARTGWPEAYLGRPASDRVANIVSMLKIAEQGRPSVVASDGGCRSCARAESVHVGVTGESLSMVCARVRAKPQLAAIDEGPGGDETLAVGVAFATCFQCHAAAGDDRAHGGGAAGGGPAPVPARGDKHRGARR